MTNETGTTDPFDLGEPLTREQYLEQLETRFAKHADDEGVPALSQEELLVAAELLGEFNKLVNPGAVDSDRWGRLAVLMASRIYSRLGI